MLVTTEQDADVLTKYYVRYDVEGVLFWEDMATKEVQWLQDINITCNLPIITTPTDTLPTSPTTTASTVTTPTTTTSSPAILFSSFVMYCTVLGPHLYDVIKTVRF